MEGSKTGITLFVLVALASCAEPLETFSTELLIVDELGAPISGISVDFGDEVRETDKRGRIALPELDGPLLAVASGPTRLPEPVILGRSDRDRTVTVRMLSDNGGQRWVMHSAGDVMFGRRYLGPATEPGETDGDSGEYLIDPNDIAGTSAEVIEPIRRAFVAADVQTVNLDSVLTNLPDSAAYPAKRSLFKSSPEAIAALQALSVDVAVLANDHMRDYGDTGIADTMAALDGEGIARVGAFSGDPALGGNQPVVVDVAGIRVGVLAWSTVTGSPVNDRYPTNQDVVDIDPEDLDESVRWKRETRPWGFVGTTASIDVQTRTAGEAWQKFKELEADLVDPSEIASAWSSLAQVYPEMQDWVARRGHGGAALWDDDSSPAAIASLRDSADLVVVQLHSGFTYSDAPSRVGRAAARKAIDAGADIVLAHHTHVVQGAEWYKGKLIVYSLGNLAYDLDVLEALPGAFLRTIWEGNQLVEARLFLFEIDGYRPVPVADRAADRTARTLWAKSVLAAETLRSPEGDIVSTLLDLDPESQPAHIRMRNHDALLTDQPPPEERREVIVPGGGETVPLGFGGLIMPVLGTPGVKAGRDLLGWGHFEDALADGEARQGTHWLANSRSELLLVDPGAGEGLTYLRLARSETSESVVQTQVSSSIALPRHRIYRDREGTLVPDDGDAEYSLRFLARRYGDVDASFRLDFYRTSSDPFAPSETTRVARKNCPFPVSSNDVPEDGKWHLVACDVLFTSEEERGDEVVVFLRLSPPEDDEAYVDVDDLAFIEWRPIADIPDRFGVYDFARNDGLADVLLPVRVLPLEAP